MNPRLTDRLACPRCGPGFGLILLADEVREGRVLEGRLGCANCREHYPVRGGYADLRPPPRRGETEGGGPGEDDAEAALRLAAFLGVREGPGILLLVGTPARSAPRLAEMIEGIEVVAAHPGLRGAPESAGVSRAALGDRLPFHSGSLRGVALDGREAARRRGEALRVLAPGARLVVADPEPDSVPELEAAGLELLLVTAKAVVGERTAAPGGR